MIVARRDFVERNPELLTKYMQLIIKGSIFAIENPEAVVRIAWSMHPEIKPKDLPEDVALRQGIGQVAARSQSLKLSGGDAPVWGAVSDREWNNYVAFLEIDPGKLRGRETYLTSRLLEKAGAFDQAEYTKWARAYRFPQAGDNRGG